MRDRCSPSSASTPRSAEVDLDRPVLDDDGEGLDREPWREAERPSRADVDSGPVARADGDALLGVEVAFCERRAVVRAAVFDRVVLASEVVDAYRDLPFLDDLHGSRRQLIHRSDRYERQLS